jgi:hypothetical protein
MSLRRLSLAVLTLAQVATAGSLSFSFTGVFTQDDQLQIFTFTAPTDTTVVRTWSYAGGINFAGAAIDPGGFDPVLSVFDATGGLVGSSLLLASNDDGIDQCPTNAPNCVSPDPSTGAAFDSLLVLSGLDPGGQYALVLSESDNLPAGPDYGSGFSQTGQGNFTATEFPCGGPTFCDANLAQRNGAWAVDILNVGAASGVPEPGSNLLVVAGLGVLELFRRRRKGR